MFLTSLFLLAVAAPSVSANCKTTPPDDFWPSESSWKDLNNTVHGHLIHNDPIGKPCYSGKGQNSKLCKHIQENYTSSFFREKFPLGYQYPLIDGCPPVNDTLAGLPLCDLGNFPVYTINATKPADVVAGIKFAKENNVRLVIKNTGHDIRQRSQGYGSLSIWMRHIRPELQFQKMYIPSSNGSCKSDWEGSAVVVGAGYVWNDVYEFSAKHGVITVGGDSKTVGAIGGYIQGGGHGPASHDFGLAADQVLEYTVVLASGEIVTASACEQTDLFTALRGGGGGTFGVVVAATIKAHPTRPVLGHKLIIAELNGNKTALLDAVGFVASRYTLLSDEGFSGNAQLSQFPGIPIAYSHNFGRMIETNFSTEAQVEQAKRVMNEEILEYLRPLNGTGISVMSTFQSFDSFQEYYMDGGHESPTSNNDIMISRFFDKKSILHQQKSLTSMLHTILSTQGSGEQLYGASLAMCLVGGGQVLNPVPHTSMNPAWRKTYMLAEIVYITSPNSGLEGTKKIRDLATNIKLKAMKDIAPGMGTYMNEADPYDPDWKQDWYGDRYDWLRSVKQKYDPDEMFWCWRCVGSEGWDEIKGGTLYGPLCRKK